MFGEWTAVKKPTPITAMLNWINKGGAKLIANIKWLFLHPVYTVYTDHCASRIQTLKGSHFEPKKLLGHEHKMLTQLAWTFDRLTLAKT